MMQVMSTVVMLMMIVVVGMVRAEYQEPDWGFQSYLDSPYTLICNHSSLMVERLNYIEWELPNGQVMSQSAGKFTLRNGMANSVVNMHLIIDDVKESDAGVYVCHVYNNRGNMVKRGRLLRGLNLGGHKYRDGFDEYRDNLMVGGIAAIVLFVPLVTACFVYKFRFQTREQKRAKHEARLDATKHQRHWDNNGKEAELSEDAVAMEKGEANFGYDVITDEVGTRL